MNLSPHANPQCGIHQLMALDHSFTRELRRDNDGLEVSVVVRLDANLRTWQAGLDQSLNFSSIHTEHMRGRERDLSPS
jgi:hypothetical protein